MRKRGKNKRFADSDPISPIKIEVDPKNFFFPFFLPQFMSGEGGLRPVGYDTLYTHTALYFIVNNNKTARKRGRLWMGKDRLRMRLGKTLAEVPWQLSLFFKNLYEIKNKIPLHSEPQTLMKKFATLTQLFLLL